MRGKNDLMFRLFVFSAVMAVCGGCFSVPALAEQGGPGFENKVALEIFNYLYQEVDMRETSTMYGLVYTGTFRKWGLLTRFEGRYGFGPVNYIYRPADFTINGAPDRTFDLKFTAGYEFPAFGMSTITPFAGFGYRYFNDNLQEILSRFPKRESNYSYCPVGLVFLTPAGDDASFSAVLEYDIFLSGLQYTEESNTNPDWEDVYNAQEKGYGCGASLVYRKKFGGFDLEAKLFERYWHIEDSVVEDLVESGVVVGEVWEPENETMEIGISAAINF